MEQFEQMELSEEILEILNGEFEPVCKGFAKCIIKAAYLLAGGDDSDEEVPEGLFEFIMQVFTTKMLTYGMTHSEEIMEELEEELS